MKVTVIESVIVDEHPAITQNELEQIKTVLRELYDSTESYADGAEDASAHDKLCNYVSSLIKPVLDLFNKPK